MSENSMIDVNEVIDTQRDKYLTFSIGTEQYALEIRYVVDIIGIQDITSVPDQPEYVKGVINLRGKIIPIMDIRIRFMKQEREYDDRTCIIVVDMKEISVGIVVDTVLEVASISNEVISPPPKFNSDYHNKSIAGIGMNNELVTIILDCSKLLNEEDLDTLSGLS